MARIIIKDTSRAQPRVTAEEVAKALGAEQTSVKVDTRRNSISLFTLKTALANNLRSSGGRPKLEGTTQKRKKFSLFEGDWEMLEEVAAWLKDMVGINVSPGQVAAVLLHHQLRKLATSALKDACFKPHASLPGSDYPDRLVEKLDDHRAPNEQVLLGSNDHRQDTSPGSLEEAVALNRDLFEAILTLGGMCNDKTNRGVSGSRTPGVRQKRR